MGGSGPLMESSNTFFFTISNDDSCVTLLYRQGASCVTVLYRHGASCVTVLYRQGASCMTVLYRHIITTFMVIWLLRSEFQIWLSSI